MPRSYRFITVNTPQEKYEQAENGNFILKESQEPEIYFQLVKVLRAKAGDEVVLQPKKETGPWWQYKFAVTAAKGKEVELTFADKFLNENELKFGLTLILCIPNRPDKLDFILQKAVELGVTGIQLVEGDFSQFKHQLRMDRLEKIVREAAEQSERAIVPGVSMGTGLQKYLNGLDKNELENCYTAMERDDNKTLIDIVTGEGAPSDFKILIGPEGGFSKNEKQLINDLGIKCFSLGKRILRMETAAILSLGIVALR